MVANSQQVVRGRLYKLHDTSRGGVGSPLLRKIPVDQVALLEASKPGRGQSLSPSPERNPYKRDSFRRSVRNLAVKDEASGGSIPPGVLFNTWS